MTILRRPVSVAIVMTPETCASSALGLLQMLRSANSPWQLPERLNHVDPDSAVGGFAPFLVGENSGSLRLAHNVVLHVSGSRRDMTTPDVVIVPEIVLPRSGSLAGMFSGWREWLIDRYRTGAVISSCSSGVAMLAEAGLLDNGRGNTHWALVERLAQQFPTVRFEAEHALIVTGTDDRLVMSGAGCAWQDLCLHLVARYAGVEAAMRLARVELLQWHEMPQRAWSDHGHLPETSDPAITRAIHWLAEHFNESAPVSMAVQHAGLAERTFTRRFHLATGVSPLEFVHRLRLARARQVLESSDLNVQSVARQLGYEDPSFFSRLFKREVSLTPAQYRKRFGALRSALENGAIDAGQP